MGYRITYPRVQKIHKAGKRKIGRLTLTGLFFALFLLFVHVFWQEGRIFLQSILIPGDVSITVSAMEDLSRALSSGIPLSDAFSAFCRSILEGAAVGPV